MVLEKGGPIMQFTGSLTPLKLIIQKLLLRLVLGKSHIISIFMSVSDEALKITVGRM